MCSATRKTSRWNSQPSPIGRRSEKRHERLGVHIPDGAFPNEYSDTKTVETLCRQIYMYIYISYNKNNFSINKIYFANNFFFLIVLVSITIPAQRAVLLLALVLITDGYNVLGCACGDIIPSTALIIQLTDYLSAMSIIYKHY